MQLIPPGPPQSRGEVSQGLVDVFRDGFAPISSPLKIYTAKSLGSPRQSRCFWLLTRFSTLTRNMTSTSSPPFEILYTNLRKVWDSTWLTSDIHLTIDNGTRGCAWKMNSKIHFYNLGSATNIPSLWMPRDTSVNFLAIEHLGIFFTSEIIILFSLRLLERYMHELKRIPW